MGDNRFLVAFELKERVPLAIVRGRRDWSRVRGMIKSQPDGLLRGYKGFLVTLQVPQRPALPIMSGSIGGFKLDGSLVGEKRFLESIEVIKRISFANKGSHGAGVQL